MNEVVDVVEDKGQRRISTRWVITEKEFPDGSINMFSFAFYHFKCKRKHVDRIIRNREKNVPHVFSAAMKRDYQ